MDLEHPAGPRQRPHRLEQRPVGQPEVVDHEGLGSRHARLDDGWNLGHGILDLAHDDEREAVIDGRIVGRQRAPVGEVPAERRAHRRRRAGRPARGRRVEHEEGGRAAERGGDRVLEEAVGLGICRYPDMGVDVDAAGQDEQASRVDDLSRVPTWTCAKVRADGDNSTITHEHVGDAGSRGRHDRAATNQKVGHRAGALRRARRSRCPGRPPRDSADPSLGDDPASRRPARSSRNGWRQAGRPSRRTTSHRRGRRSRTR